MINVQPRVNVHVIEEAEPAKDSFLLEGDGSYAEVGYKFFSGGSKPIEKDEWRSRLDRNFESIQCPDHYKKDIAVDFLERDTNTWWQGVSARINDPKCSCETFLVSLRLSTFHQKLMICWKVMSSSLPLMKRIFPVKKRDKPIKPKPKKEDDFAQINI